MRDTHTTHVDDERVAAADNDNIVIINCSNTRYHAVRAAARTLGWLVEDEDRTDVPSSYRGVTLRADDANTTAAAAAAACGVRYSAAHTPQVVWRDMSVSVTRVADMRCHQRLNHFAGMDVVARKAALFARLMRIMHACRVYADKHASNSSSGGSGDGDKDNKNDEEEESSASVYAALHATLAACVPRSFSSVTDVAALHAYCTRTEHNSSDNSEGGDDEYFIVKPNKSCMGKGIRITRCPLDALTPHTRTRAGECVVQVYVPRPLLIDGRKCDLRLYVLVLSVTAPPSPPQHGNNNNNNNKSKSKKNDDDDLRGIEVYVHEQGLVRLCASAYAPPSRDNEHSAHVHLSNNAVNKRHSNNGSNDGDEDANSDDADNDNNGGGSVTHNKRDLRFLRDYVNALDNAQEESSDGGRSETAWQALQRRIDECIALTVLSGVDVLRRELHAAGATRAARRDARACFELLGFDILLQDNRAQQRAAAVKEGKDARCVVAAAAATAAAAPLQPVLMEVNHSPSLFCDSAADFALKRTVVADALRCVQQSSGTAPLRLCDADGAMASEYAQYMRRRNHRRTHGDSSHNNNNNNVRNGFVQLLPRYARDAGDTRAPQMQQQQRRRQQQLAMLRVARAHYDIA